MFFRLIRAASEPCARSAGDDPRGHSHPCTRNHSRGVPRRARPRGTALDPQGQRPPNAWVPHRALPPPAGHEPDEKRGGQAHVGCRPPFADPLRLDEECSHRLSGADHRERAPFARLSFGSTALSAIAPPTIKPPHVTLLLAATRTVPAGWTFGTIAKPLAATPARAGIQAR